MENSKLLIACLFLLFFSCKEGNQATKGESNHSTLSDKEESDSETKERYSFKSEVLKNKNYSYKVKFFEIFKKNGEKYNLQVKKLPNNSFQKIKIIRNFLNVQLKENLNDSDRSKWSFPQESLFEVSENSEGLDVSKINQSINLSDFSKQYNSYLSGKILFNFKLNKILDGNVKSINISLWDQYNDKLIKLKSIPRGLWGRDKEFKNEYEIETGFSITQKSFLDFIKFEHKLMLSFSLKNQEKVQSHLNQKRIVLIQNSELNEVSEIVDEKQLELHPTDKSSNILESFYDHDLVMKYWESAYLHSNLHFETRDRLRYSFLMTPREISTYFKYYKFDEFNLNQKTSFSVDMKGRKYTLIDYLGEVEREKLLIDEYFEDIEVRFRPQNGLDKQFSCALKFNRKSGREFIRASFGEAQRVLQIESGGEQNIYEDYAGKILFYSKFNSINTEFFKVHANTPNDLIRSYKIGAIEKIDKCITNAERYRSEVLSRKYFLKELKHSKRHYLSGKLRAYYIPWSRIYWD